MAGQVMSRRKVGDTTPSTGFLLDGFLEMQPARHFGFRAARRRDICKLSSPAARSESFIASSGEIYSWLATPIAARYSGSSSPPVATPSKWRVVLRSCLPCLAECFRNQHNLKQTDLGQIRPWKTPQTAAENYIIIKFNITLIYSFKLILRPNCSAWSERLRFFRSFFRLFARFGRSRNVCRNFGGFLITLLTIFAA